MFWRDSTKYLYEYKTPQGKWDRIVGNILVRIMAIVMLYFVFVMLRALISEALTRQVAVPGGWFIGTILIILLVVLIIVVYNPAFIPLDISEPMLIVRISQEEIFLRNNISSAKPREHILIGRVKNADVKLYGESEFDYLYNSIVWYNEKGGLRWSRDPLRSIFKDHSTGDYGMTRCAVLELADGKQVFIGFKGAEEFLAALNNLRSSS